MSRLPPPSSGYVRSLVTCRHSRTESAVIFPRSVQARFASPITSRGYAAAARPGPATIRFKRKPSEMTATFDTVIRSGRIVNSDDQFVADVGVRNGIISAIGNGLPAGAREIDASSRLVLPGGVDNHAHIEQISASGLLNADNWESGTRAAAFGGTTTVIAFAAQHVGMKLRKVVDDYHDLARKGAVIDYSFHLIIADPNPETLGNDLPALLDRGYQSVKLFTTYDKLKIDDESFLDILKVTGRYAGLVSVHAENHGMIKWRTKNLLASGHTAPISHAMAHPREAEIDAIGRVIQMAELTGQPIMIFHVSTAEGAAIVRRARSCGQRVYAETCPQYLLLTEASMDRPLPGRRDVDVFSAHALRKDPDRESCGPHLRAVTCRWCPRITRHMPTIFREASRRSYAAL